MIKRELGVFLVVGALVVLVDYLTYRALSWWGALSLDAAKAVGFVTGTVFAYFANRFWTFGRRRHVAGSMRRFALLYAFTLSTNVAINALILKVSFGLQGSVQFAFLIATAVSATTNFVGMKSFVFKEVGPSQST